ncbi:transporter, partial [Roseateles sp. GG27B]
QRSPATAGGVAGGGSSSSSSTQYGIELGLAAYELDFFGRVRSLSESAMQSFFAVEENRRSTQIGLVAEV